MLPSSRLDLNKNLLQLFHTYLVVMTLAIARVKDRVNTEWRSLATLEWRHGRRLEGRPQKKNLELALLFFYMFKIKLVQLIQI